MELVGLHSQVTDSINITKCKHSKIYFPCLYIFFLSTVGLFISNNLVGKKIRSYQRRSPMLSCKPEHILLWNKTLRKQAPGGPADGKFTSVVQLTPL